MKLINDTFTDLVIEIIFKMFYNGFKRKLHMRKSGFTLAEILLVLVIVGIIAAITIPALVRTIPNKDEENHKKLNYQLEQIVSMMYNDEGMYPKNDIFRKSGFKNTDSVMIKDRVFEGNTKFCELLAEQFEKTSSTVACGTLDTPDVITFSTTDGMNWYVPKTTFANGWTTLKVDINGDKIRKGNKINACSTKDITTNPTKCKKPDLYTYFIRSNGTIVVADTKDGLTNDSATPYSVTFELLCDGETNSNCGSVTLTTQGGVQKDPISGAGGTVTDLPIGKHTISISPGSGYYSNYPTNTRTVTVDGSMLDTKVKILFAKKEKLCIYVNVNDCNQSSPTDCASFTINNTKVMTQVSDSGLNYSTMQYCNLPRGDYTLKVTPVTGQYLVPVPYDNSGNPTSAYTQKVKLGTEDVYLNVTFTDQEPSPVTAGVPVFDRDNTVYPEDEPWVEPEEEEPEEVEFHWYDIGNGIVDCTSGGKTECGSMRSGLSPDYWARGNYICLTYTSPRRLMPNTTELTNVLRYVAAKGTDTEKSNLLNRWIYSVDELSTTTAVGLRYDTSTGTVLTETLSKGSASFKRVICVP